MRSQRARSVDERREAKLAKTVEEWMRDPSRRDLKQVDYPKEKSEKKEKTERGFPSDIVREVLESKSSAQLAKLLEGTPLVEKRVGYVHVADLYDKDIGYDKYEKVEHLQLKVSREEAIKYLLKHQERLKPLRKEIKRKIEDKKKLEKIDKIYSKYAQECSREELQRQKKEFGFILTEHRQISWDHIVNYAGGLENIEGEKDKVLFRDVINGVEHYVAIREIKIKNKKPIKVLVHGTARSLPIYYKIKGEKYEF